MQTRGTIEIGMYSCRLTVIFTDDSLNKIYKSLLKKYSESHPVLEEPGAIAFSPDSDITVYYIIIGVDDNREVDLGTLIHEIDHIKNYILSHRGVHYTRHNDESGSYLSGYIADGIYKLMKKKELSFQ